MRVLVINPNTTREMTEAIEAVAQSAASPGIEVEAISPEAGPSSVEGFTDEVLAAHHTVDLVAATHGSYDGYAIACFGDPGLLACREVADVPVVGIAEAAFRVASLIAYRWSIVTVLPRVEPLIREVVRRNAVESSCASIRCAPLSVLEIEQDLERTKRLMLEEAESAIAEDAAEAILLGCAGLGPLEVEMRRALGVPVLDGTSCAVKLLEGLGGLGLSSSRVRAFLPPEAKRVAACSPGLKSVYEPDHDLSAR